MSALENAVRIYMSKGPAWHCSEHVYRSATSYCDVCNKLQDHSRAHSNARERAQKFLEEWAYFESLRGSAPSDNAKTE